jgi:Zn-dependent peptidase ImmA (M78 family)
MSRKWIEDLASGFWTSVGSEEPFPRSLEHTIRCARPFDIVRLPGLCPRVILRWLERQRYLLPLQTKERRLNGCLLVLKGMAFVFVEEGLAADDARMIVAHELAHYLAEYEEPRERARRRMGPALLEVFDGERPPTQAEQLQAALAGVALGVHDHYMERRSDSTYPEPVSQVERTANELALELIAPWRTVLAVLRAQGPLPGEATSWEKLLRERFGLPASWAAPYARQLLMAARQRRTFSETLGF